MFVIKIYDFELIDKIYKKCFELFKQDFKCKKAFLSFINTSMLSLKKYYPEYIKRLSLGTSIIVDSINYKIENLSTSHVYPYYNNIK